MKFYVVKYSWDNGDYFFLSGVYSSIQFAKIAMANGIEILNIDQQGLTSEVIELKDTLLSIIVEDFETHKQVVLGLYSTVKSALETFLQLTMIDDVTTFGIRKMEYINPMMFYIIPQNIDTGFIRPTNLY